jgi:hypothetical protein
MDGAQITGTASSYARKYCLNGLFLIDDTKDADTDEHRKETDAKAKKGKATEEQVRQIKEIAAKQEFAISDDEIRSWTEAYAAKVINQYTGGNR